MRKTVILWRGFISGTKAANEEPHNLFPDPSTCFLNGMPVLNAFSSGDRNLGLLNDHFTDPQPSSGVDPGVFMDDRKEEWR